MGLWGNNNSNGNGLMPGGLGGGPSNEQKQLFGQAAQDSGLAAMGVGMLDQMTGGNKMSNENQVQMFYNLMATHPNEVSLFFLHYPEFMKNFFEVFRLIIKQELYSLFSSDAIPQFKIDAAKGTELGYATITQENIDAAIAKTVPLQQMQMEVSQADMQAMNQINSANMGMVQQGMTQQQQMYQQQMHQQQMMMQQPQRPGMGSTLGGFGASLIRGTLGLPQPQQQPMMGYPQMPPQM
tara:strand:- start:26265 stop:26978 length:714 start_codon:yes stop_codon:yes gene_type:complete